jgi:cobaltochelatase CobT
MSADDDAVEPLKQAVSSALRALSGRRGVEVAFAAQPGQRPEGMRASLPEPPGKPTAKEVAVLRGHADAQAFWLACHQEAIHRRLAPAAPDARRVFDALEQVRCEAIGANRLVGVADNLRARLDDRCCRAALAAEGGERAREEALALLVRERLTGQALPASALGVLAPWREALEARAGATLDHLSEHLEDQPAFARTVLQLLGGFGLLDLGADSGADDEDDALVEVEGDDDERAPDGDEDEARAAARPLLDDHSDAGGPAYRAYTDAFDETVAAEALCSAAELDQLRAELDTRWKDLQGVVGRLANRLQRSLLARQRRSWAFDLEEGVLDPTRLPRVVIDELRGSAAPLTFRQERDTAFRDTVVTLLLDNSGSMRGNPIAMAATCADVLARTLERCGVKVEILGFTTSAWKGGNSKKAWLKARRPPQPGRLNDLRHIVYKAADAPWRRARRNLGLMMRPDLLKENIDGEALAWAHQRLLARREQRRILMMISDGAPVDDATLAANGHDYLERHLRRVIADIERRSPVELVAIGIGHDVTRYFRRAVTLVNAAGLGDAMTEKLAELFADAAPSRRSAQRRAAGLHRGPR